MEVKKRINHLRRLILIHSCIYYRMNTSVVDDFTFNEWSEELVKLQNENESILSECIYSNAFEDFDGTTGYDLPLDDNWIEARSMYILALHEKYK
ncbi:DNA ligase LigA-related protein [Clostridium argentinense]|nr:hypothetical protein [Clostridium argentinense]NFP51796.1 hypothetical protein [Clostridium argentinense]NFP74234.1 hypothetical protein [Clostridium argentinense]NFP78375.1 hypothetical protein [Clostridium argentinense]BBB39323.1 hypothetical protein [Clostridium argentinense]